MQIQEYINTLYNNRDPCALTIIRNIKNTITSDSVSEEYKSYYAFLDRIEAYVLIEWKMYDEAKTLLKEM